MSGGISASTIIGAVATGIAGAVASSVLTKKQSAPSAADVPKPEAPPVSQVSKTPDVNALRQRNAAAEGGPGMSANATLLTGPSGVSNDLLSLGKNTLLGA